MNTDIFIEIARASYGAAISEVDATPHFDAETPRRAVKTPANGKSAIHGTLIHLENGGCVVSSHEDQTDNQRESRTS
jgi:hypothetical protein